MDTKDISLYKPQVSVAKTFEVDETLDEPELSFEVFKKLVLARKTENFLFVTIGKMLKMVRDKKLYKHLDYDNFSQFLHDDQIDFSREKAYMYIRIYEVYVEGLQLSEESVAGVGVARLNMLTPVVKGMSKEEAAEEIEAKRDIRYGEFVRQIKQQTNKDGKPEVYFSQEHGKWIVRYYENTTMLLTLGKFGEEDNG